MKPLIILVLTAANAIAQSTISDSYKHSWGANIGWTIWKPSNADGVRVSQYTLSGWVWAANVGWIHHIAQLLQHRHGEKIQPNLRPPPARAIKRRTVSVFP